MNPVTCCGGERERVSGLAGQELGPRERERESGQMGEEWSAVFSVLPGGLYISVSRFHSRRRRLLYPIKSCALRACV